MQRIYPIAFIFAVACVVTHWAHAEELPPATSRIVDFTSDIKPILQNNCFQCHGNGRNKGAFRIDTRASILAGGESKLAGAVDGKSGESHLIAMLAGLDPDSIMPKKGRRLNADEIGLLRAWIDQGMKWPDGFTFGAKHQPIAPRRPSIDMASAEQKKRNPIDMILDSYFATHHITPAKVVDDRIFARRVYMDVTGMLPPPVELEKFVADTNEGKRAALINDLLNDKHAYAQHWMSFWNDALRNDYRGTGFVDGGRKQITSWLYNALASNMPYDEFVRELITEGNGSQGFIKGIIWRGVVNASQTPQMQAAQNISQVFMGVNLKCASCHDSFINEWKLSDAYGLASIFADKPLEMERCNKPLGEFAPVKFLYPSLGAIEGSAPREARVKRLAEIITSETNGRLSRTIVNRLWHRFMGRAIIMPLDDMDQDPWNSDLLDWLSSELQSNKYDLKITMAAIMTSRAYQLPAVATRDGAEEFVFSGPLIRRMSAEEFVDAVSIVTRTQSAKPVAKIGSTTQPANRTALCNADALTTAMGRPNREQTVTDRPSIATTLEALELTNGQTLAEHLKRGAAALTNEIPECERLVNAIYMRALGRKPTDAEKKDAMALVGVPTRNEGVEDLLWAIFMLPEFQLIR